MICSTKSKEQKYNETKQRCSNDKGSEMKTLQGIRSQAINAGQVLKIFPKKRNSPHVSYIKSKEGEIILEKSEIMNRWSKYMRVFFPCNNFFSRRPSFYEERDQCNNLKKMKQRKATKFLPSIPLLFSLFSVDYKCSSLLDEVWLQLHAFERQGPLGHSSQVCSMVYV